MIFSHPIFLWLLIPAAIAAGYVLISRKVAQRHRMLAALTRLLAIAAAVVAISRPLMPTQLPGKVAVAVIDCSPSVPDSEIARAMREVKSQAMNFGSDDTLRVVAFSGRAQLIEDTSEFNSANLEKLRNRLDSDSKHTGSSSLEDALRLAGALIENGRPGRVLLFSDGLQTQGDAAAQATRLADMGIPINITPLKPDHCPQVQITHVSIPQTTTLGSSVPCTLELYSTADSSIKIAALANTQPTSAAIDVTLHRGSQTVSLPLPVNVAGLNPFTIQLSSNQSVVDSAQAAVWGLPSKRVIVVDGGGDNRTASALNRILGTSATVSTIASESLSDFKSLEQVDLLVLANTTSNLVNDKSQANIIAAVENGTGLLVTGGPSSFGAGGWSESKLAEVLPVRLPQELERQDPSATAVFIIDTSGSMTGPRISLAKEVVRLALKRLQVQDKAGIVEFYGSKRWAAPIQSAANQLDLNRALNRLTAGGGTVILPAIEEAEFALKNVNTRTRHVVILTDGGVESGPFEMLSRRMADSGITVSTVLVGPGAHSPFLASIAQWGHGRFYHAPDRFNLPEIILHQPQTNSPPPIVQVPTKVTSQVIDDITRQLDLAAAPTITGYVRTQPKPTSDILLQAGGDALLSRWQYGRGRVATFSTDIASIWTSDFGQWQGSSVLLANLCRSLYAPPLDRLLNISAQLRQAGLEVQIDTSATNSPDRAQPVDLEIASIDPGTMRKLTIDPIRPGVWNALIKNLPPGNYNITARTSSGNLSGRGSMSIELPRELQSDQPNEKLFKQIELISNHAKSQPEQSKAIRYAELWPWLIATSLVMFILNVFIRRRPLLTRVPVRATAILAIAICFGSFTNQSIAAPSTQPAADALDAGDLNKAMTELDALVKESPDNSWALSTQSFLCEIRGDSTKAVDLLAKAAQAENDPAKSALLRTRLTVLQRDLNIEASDSPAAETQVSQATVAAIYGRYDLTAKWTSNLKESADPFPLLLRGTSLLRINEPQAAGDCFSSAITLPKQSRDRKYVIERLIAASRGSGKLASLADSWLADSNLPAERLLPLVGILRELGRTDDILSLWRRKPADPASASVITSARFVTELIAATREVNRLKDAETVCRAALDADPDNSQWINALAKILIEQDRIEEVDTILRKSAAAATTASQLMRVAQTAQGLSRDDLAIEIARKSASQNVASAVGAELFCAQVEKHRGNRAESLAAMNRAAELAGKDHKLLASVAEVFEQSGDRPRSIALYRQAAEGGEDVMQKLAWLLEQDNQLPESQKIWTNLWRTAGSTARKREAQNRLLDLASRTGTIADVAAELEDRLESGKASGEDLGLLIDIYVGARDAASASEILAKYKSLAGGEKEATDQLAKLYLKCGRFGQADRALRQLLVLDPDHAIDTLQEIAVLAIERTRPAEAQAALEEIARRTGTDASTAELRAGVYEQLQLFNEAAKEYHRAIKLNPDQVEDWVLWAGAMNQAGQKDQAINRLLILALQAEGDDLFTIAVDGLLNLEAPKEAMRIARRCAIARVAKDDRKLVLYELIRDLSESMGDDTMGLRAGEISLLVAGEQRTELIRELITLCKSSGQAQQSIELGRTLLALGDQVPPQVFLDIGKSLIDEKRFSEADSAFARAEEASDDDEIRMQVAKMYESAGQTRLALGTLHPLVQLHPNDIELHARSGGMHEQLGQHAEAFELYLDALQLMLKRGTVGGTAASTLPTTGVNRGVARQGVSMTEADQYLDGLVQGLINCARTEELQNKLIATMKKISEAELNAAQKDSNVPSVCSERSALLRRFAFALHQPDAADQFDLAVHEKYPDDKVFSGRAVTSRLEWGLLDRASQIADKLGQPQPQQIALRNTLLHPSSEKLTTDPDEASLILPRLLMLNQNDRARQMLGAVERKPPRKPASLALLLAASIVLDDTASAEVWSGIWITRIETQKGGKPDIAEAEECVRRCWPALSNQARKSMLGRIAKWSERIAVEDQTTYSLLCLRLAVQLAEPPEMKLIWARQSLATAPANGSLVCEVLAAIPAAERPALLAKATENVASQKRRSILLQFLSACDYPLDKAFADQFINLLEESPTGSVADRREQLTGGTWMRNPLHTEILKRLPPILLKDAGDDAGIRIAVAQIYATINEPANADKVALEAVNLLVAGNTKKGRFDSRTLSDAVSILSQNAANDLLHQNELSQSDSQFSVPANLLKVSLLEQTGQPAKAMEVLRKTFEKVPTDLEVKRLYTDHLEADLRFAEMIDAFTPYLKDDTVVNAPQRFRLQKAYRQLNRFEEAGTMMTKDDSPVKQLQRLQLAAESGMTDELLPLFRTFHVDNRWERRSFAPFMIPAGGMGGLVEFNNKRDELNPMSARVSIYKLVAPLAWAPDELNALLRGAIPETTEVPTLATAISAACDSENAYKEVSTALDSAKAKNAITSKDRALIAALLRDGHPLSHDVTTEIDDSLILLNPATDSEAIGNLGQSLKAVNDENRAQAVNRWKLVADLLLAKTGPTRTRTAAAEQVKLDARLLQAAGPSPGDLIDENAEAIRLSALADIDLEKAEASIEAMRSQGRIQIFARSQLAALSTRLTGQRGDLTNFESRAIQTLNNWPTRLNSTTPDIRLLLPKSDSPNARQMVEILKSIVLKRISDDPSDKRLDIHYLVLLGDWYASQNLKKEAQSCVESAQAANLETGEPLLWIADLIRKLGDNTQADQIELKMLNARSLPLDRIAPLIDRLRKSAGDAQADALASDVSKYCKLRTTTKLAN